MKEDPWRREDPKKAERGAAEEEEEEGEAAAMAVEFRVWAAAAIAIGRESLFVAQAVNCGEK